MKKKDKFDIISDINDIVDYAADIMEDIKGSFRLTDGKKNGNNFSFKYYKSGWKGGSRAQIKTYNVEKIGNRIHMVTKPLSKFFSIKDNVNTIIDVVDDIKDAYKEDGNNVGVKTKVKVSEKIGELIGVG